MSTKIIKIPADRRARIETIEVESLRYPQLNEALFDGGLIEQVRARGLAPLTSAHSTQRVVMLVDEEGLGKGLPFNPRASILYGMHVHGQPIVGDAFIVGEIRDSEGEWDWGPLPDYLTMSTLPIYHAIDEVSENTGLFKN